MSELGAELAELGPRRRQLLEQLLRREGGDPARLAIGRAPRGGEPLPLSPGQLGIWLHEQASPGHAAYNMPAVVRLRGDLDTPALAAALAQLVARHEALRTTVRLHDGEPVQQVVATAAVDLEIRSLAGETDLRRACAAEAARPFDLARGPLLRALLLRLGDRDHALALTLHHIAGDRWSMGVLLQELAACYQAALLGRPCPLPPPPLQYADFAAWQRRRLQGDGFAAALDWWRRRLAVTPLLLELPADRPRPPLPSGRGARLARRLPATASAALRAVCARHAATPFMVLLAAFQALLQRLTDRERLVVGVPVAGRQRPETAGLVGCLVNTVALAGDLAGDPTFGELLGRARESVLSSFAHQDLPFQRLIEELRPARDPRYNPVYQVMLAPRDIAVPLRELAPGLALSPLDVHAGAAQVDLTLVVDVPAAEAAPAAGGGVETSWEYSTDLFDAPRMARLAGHFATLVQAALAAPETRLSDLPLLAAGERWQLLGEWSGPLGGGGAFEPAAAPGVPDAAAGCVQEPFEARADLSPAAVAVDCDGRLLTYGEVERRANRLARRLRDHGVAPEVAVGVLLERSPAMIVALLAVLKAGGVYVPLDPQHPWERLAFILEDAGVRVLIAGREPAGALPAGCRLLDLERDAGEVARQGAARPQPWAGCGNLAYVVYTSGSTGRPKGVGVGHGAARRHLASWQRQRGLAAADRVYQFASLSFDASLEQILSTLYAGARLVVRGSAVPTPDELVRQIAAGGLTVAYLPTAYWQQVCRAWAEGEGSAGSLRLVNPGGDVMPPEAVRLYHRSPAGAVPLLNGYGPTEAVVTAAVHQVRPGSCDGEAALRVPIGRPFGNRAIYLLDRRGQPVPPGVPGELHAGGPLLARGYVGRPRLTAERFVPDPFGGAAGARLYATGDLACHGADGTLGFLGRRDNQVKVRGFRVELGEIEAALRRLDAVGEAVVTAPETAAGQRRLVAYVVKASAAGGAPKDMAAAAPAELAAALAAQLRAALPEHMVPAAFVLLERLPFTAGGKVDRQALPAPQEAAAVEEGEEGGAAPRNAAEELLARLWAAALGRARVGIHDNFFRLGGDSIVSLRIIAQAQRAGMQLTPSLFFRSPTVAGLAAAAGAVARQPAAVESTSGPVPLTPIQRWFFEQEMAAPHHWNQAVLFDLGRRADAATLRQAVRHLVDHHDALRHRFVRAGGEWRQLADPPGGAPPFVEIALAALPEPLAPAAARRAAAALQAGFDLARGPLLRVALLDLGPARQSLLVAVHHLVMDGVSWRILLDDLQEAYGRLRAGRAVELPPKTASMRRWAEHLAAQAASPRLAAEAGLWLAALLPAGPSPLPPADPAGSNTAADAAEVAVELSAGDTRRLLEDAPAACRVRVDHLLLAALAQGFAAATGGTTLLVELEGHGREAIGAGPDVSRTIGWFTAKYPLLLDLAPLAGAASPGAALKAVKERLAAVPGGGLGYGPLRYLAAPEVAGKLREMAPPEVTFNYLGRFAATATGDLPLSPVLGAAGPECGPRNRRPSLLEVVSLVLDGRLRVFWRYSRALHGRAAIEALAAAFLAALHGLLEHSATPEAGVWLPADFPLAAIDGPALDRLRRRLPSLEDLYPLSPVQQGMLFHSLSSPASGVYVEQLVLELGGELDTVLFERAWRRVLEAHPALRTAFVWEGLAEPLQAVCREVPLPFIREDWRGCSPAEQEERLGALLAADRARGFDLAAAPLLRLFACRTAEDRWRFIWSNHHLLVDGWAEPLVLEEVFALYEAFRAGRDLRLAPRTPYRAYIDWLRRQDPAPAEAYWRRTLRGFTRPTPMAADPAAAAGSGNPAGNPEKAENAEEELLLSVETTAALQALLRRRGLTFNTLVQGGWALLLGHDSGAGDVVLGVTVSGRPPALPGVEAMIGMFINTLPLRAELRPRAEMAAWLGEIQERTAELLQYEHSHLVQIQRCSELPRGVPLFETIVVSMNQPRDYSWTGAPRAGVRLLGAHGIEQTNYPFTVTASMGSRLLLQINYQCRRFGRSRVRRVLGLFEALCALFLENPAVSLHEVREALARADLRLRAGQAERQRSARTAAFREVRRRPAAAAPPAAEMETRG
jgi:amino acid adenylation domain-containing protein/non-ribosomal peptide synthase protein (TIGR01720 family)